MDIIKWINLILSWEPNARIVLHGVSMGAATVLMASGEDLPGNVKAVIADCGYTSEWDEFRREADALTSVVPRAQRHIGIVKDS